MYIKVAYSDFKSVVHYINRFTLNDELYIAENIFYYVKEEFKRNNISSCCRLKGSSIHESVRPMSVSFYIEHDGDPGVLESYKKLGMTIFSREEMIYV